jgi:hypothetical protein
MGRGTGDPAYVHSAVTGAVVMFYFSARAGWELKPKSKPKPSGWSRALRSPTRAGDVGDLATRSGRCATECATTKLRAIETKLLRENACARESVRLSKFGGGVVGGRLAGCGSAGASAGAFFGAASCQPAPHPSTPRDPLTRHGHKQQNSLSVCVQEETAQRACVKALSCRHVRGRCILC